MEKQLLDYINRNSIFREYLLKIFARTIGKEEIIKEFLEGKHTSQDARTLLSVLYQKSTPRKKRGVCFRCGTHTKDYSIKGYYVCGKCMENAVMDLDDFLSFTRCVICEDNISVSDKQRGRGFLVYKGKLICKDCLVKLKLMFI